MSAAARSFDAAGWSVSAAYPAGPTVVRLRGEVDAAVASHLQTCLIGGVEQGADMVIDLAQADLVDRTCLGVLVRAHCRARSLGLVIALAAPPPSVRRCLAVTGTDRILPVYAELVQATLQLRQHALEHVWPERLRRARVGQERNSRWRQVLGHAASSHD